MLGLGRLMMRWRFIKFLVISSYWLPLGYLFFTVLKINHRHYEQSDSDAK